MQKSETIKELASALASAQGEIENASKNSSNPHFRSKYADLAEVINTVRPVFSKHGLSVVQFPSYDASVCSVETVITHKSGEWMSGMASCRVTKDDAQGVGSAITYLRRYSLAAAAGIAQEDDDGNGAVGHSPKKIETISEDEAANLVALVQEVGADLSQFRKWLKVEKLEDLPKSAYPQAIAALEKKRQQDVPQLGEHNENVPGY